MKARSMLEGATYDPKTLRVVCQAFDDAWADISKLYYYPAEAEHARFRLAKSVLAVAPVFETEVHAIKNAALQHFALNYRDRSSPTEPLLDRIPLCQVTAKELGVGANRLGGNHGAAGA